MGPQEHIAEAPEFGIASELETTVLHLATPEGLQEEPLPEEPVGFGGGAPPAFPPSAPPPAAVELAHAAAAGPCGFGGAAEAVGEAQLAAACEPPPGAELPAPPQAWSPRAAAPVGGVAVGGGGACASSSSSFAHAVSTLPFVAAEAQGPVAADMALIGEAPEMLPTPLGAAAPLYLETLHEEGAAAELDTAVTEAAFEEAADGCPVAASEQEWAPCHGAPAGEEMGATGDSGGYVASDPNVLLCEGELTFEGHSDSLPSMRAGPAYEEPTTAAEVFMAELRRERGALLQELCRLKAKFELTLETLRSILRLGPESTWADIIERCEAVACSGGSDSTCSSPQPLAAIDADLERERLEENLEAQAAYNVRLRELLQKQQVLLDMTAQMPPKPPSDGVDLKAECDRLTEKLREQQDDISRQDFVNQQQAERIALLEAELGEERRRSIADRKLRETEADRLRADSEQKRAEVRELVETLARREDLVDHLRSQLQVHEAAERRKRSYHPSRTNSGVSEDAASDFNSSVGSGRTSARGPTRGGSEQEFVAVPPRPLEEMGRDERDAFLSHFPMSSRTERQMRNRLDDRRRPRGVGP